MGGWRSMWQICAAASRALSYTLHVIILRRQTSGESFWDRLVGMTITTPFNGWPLSAVLMKILLDFVYSNIQYILLHVNAHTTWMHCLYTLLNWELGIKLSTWALNCTNSCDLTLRSYITVLSLVLYTTIISILYYHRNEHLFIPKIRENQT